MTDESYTLLEALKDEARFQKELAEESEERGATITAMVHSTHKDMLTRIIRRYESGDEYYLGVSKGKPTIKMRKTNKHLVRENPAVAKAQRNLDTVTTLVDGEIK